MRFQQPLECLSAKSAVAPKHQVLYTTHSPFMVSADQLHRLRTVIDHDEIGTKISAKVFKADEDTAFPLYAAMGIGMPQSLFIGGHTLLLEGPSDLIYLDVLSDALTGLGRCSPMRSGGPARRKRHGCGYFRPKSPAMSRESRWTCVRPKAHAGWKTTVGATTCTASMTTNGGTSSTGRRWPGSAAAAAPGRDGRSGPLAVTQVAPTGSPAG